MYRLSSRHRRTLEAVLAEPVNGNIEWVRIVSLLRALGCNVVQRSGSSVMVEKSGMRAYFHQPHPGKEALRYRVKDVRAFLARIGIERP